MITGFNRFVYRIPYYPVNTVAVPVGTEQETDAYIRLFFSEPSFRHAMYTASPEFSKEIDLFLEGEITGGKRLTKFRHAAMRYIGRMGSRPTPFGLFSALGVGQVGTQDSIVPNVSNRFTPNVRLDMGLLTAFAEYILADAILRKTLRFYTNNTIYAMGEKYRYAECTVKDGEKLYNLSSFDKNDYIDAIIAAAKNGLLIAEIAALLVDDEVTMEEAEAFVNELVDSTILISELEPVMTGVEYHTQVYHIIRDKYHTVSDTESAAAFYEKSYQIFEKINQHIHAVRSHDQSAGENQYHEIIRLAEQLDVKYPVRHHIQLDCYANNNEGAATLSEDLIKQIAEGVSVCTRFCSHGPNTNFTDFKKKFSSKYGVQHVPLSEVLDPEHGIGYGNTKNEMLDITPFVDDLPVGQREDSGTMNVQWDKKIHNLLLSKVIEAERTQVKAVELTTAEVEHLRPKMDLLPPTFNAFVSISYNEAGTPQIYYHQVGATSAGCLLGRFGYMDSQVESLIKDISDSESAYYHGKIVAEINHLSESRAGNVMLRPRNREYEICYLTKSNVQEPGKIELDDLLLTLRGDRLVLFSKSLQKEIVPRLTNAHNYYKDTLPVYRFLSDLQEEETNGYLALAMDIGHIPAMVNFVPRICYKNFVIWPAHWYIPTEDIRRWFELPDEEFMQHMKTYLEQQGIPKWFYLTNRENDFFVNSDSLLSLRAFANEVKETLRISIKENMNTPDGKFLIGNAQGSFLHELIVPLKKEPVYHNETTPFTTSVLTPDSEEKLQVQRKFFPGDEWVFFKIYTGIKAAEKIVETQFEAFVNHLEAQQLISQWFFLRYADPDFHLRFRVKLHNKNDYGKVVAQFFSFFEPQLEQGTIKNILLDTYDRELERYGPRLMDAAEQIFHIDSLLIVQLISNIQQRGLQQYRWLLAMGIMESYYNAFGFTGDRRLEFVKSIRDNFAEEFHANKMQRRYFSTKFRNEKSTIDNFMLQQQLEGHELSWFFELTTAFEAKLTAIYQQHYSKEPAEDTADYLNSLVHMSLDRLFSSKNRPHEYALYSLLEQFYRYQIGKSKHAAHEVEI